MMKVGDLVRHRFDGHFAEVGVVLRIKRGAAHPAIGLVEVMWAPASNSQKNKKMYRMRDLEVVNAKN